MIIDILRDLSNSELNRYEDIVARWWEQQEKNNRYFEELQIECKNACGYRVKNPEDFESLVLKGVTGDFVYGVTKEELEWIGDLQIRTDNIIDSIKSAGFMLEMLYPGSGCYEILRWLEKKNASYYLVHNQYPNKKDYLYFRNSDMDLYKEAYIIRSSYCSPGEYSFLVEKCGWKKIKRIDNLFNAELFKWLNEVCEGNWKLESYNQLDYNLYFELESDLILYKTSV